ncbi:MAG: helix-turn-helix domain-containing protein [Verrucomicrobia bacterium]|nr:helix-turn-helix domain-containing protein [Verrucomicrobiota bacterium]
MELTFLQEGGLSYELNAARLEIPPRRMGLFWGGIPHRCLAWSGILDIRVICLPMPYLMTSRLPRPFLKSLLSGRASFETDSRASSRDGQLMQMWDRDIRKGDQALQSIVASEIEARLRRLAWETAGMEGGLEAPGGDALSRFLGILCLHACDHLTVADMAQRAGLHPKYAFRLFKKNFGITPLEYLHRLRISHVQRLLSTTRQRVLDIALECGFGSASQFYDVFQKICATSPDNFRKRAELIQEASPPRRFHSR